MAFQLAPLPSRPFWDHVGRSKLLIYSVLTLFCAFSLDLRLVLGYSTSYSSYKQIYDPSSVLPNEIGPITGPYYKYFPIKSSQIPSNYFPPGYSDGVIVVKPKLIKKKDQNSLVKYNNYYKKRGGYEMTGWSPVEEEAEVGQGSDIFSPCSLAKFLIKFSKGALTILKGVLKIFVLVFKIFLFLFVYVKFLYLIKSVFVALLFLLLSAHHQPTTPAPTCLCGGMGTLNNTMMGRGLLEDYENRWNVTLPQPRIVGGTETGVCEIPWRASINLNGSPLNMPECMGTIISMQYVLTSALCLLSVDNLETIEVNVGDHNLAQTGETMNQQIPVAGVDDVIFFPNFNPENNPFEHNLVLLKLSRPLEFSECIQPVCLPWELAAPPGNTEMTTSGWGFTGSEMYPDTLQKTMVMTLSAQECRDRFIAMGMPELAADVFDTMICTFSPGKGVWLFDAGTSLDYLDPTTGRYYAFGLMNWQTGMTGGESSMSPQAYNYLPQYLDWIRENTQGEEFCIP